MINGLPEKLKKLRMQYGLSQRAVAMQLNISPAIISGYETGERTPSVEILLALSYLYRCKTDYLLGKESDDPSKYICVDGLNEKQIQAIQELINSIK